MAYSDCETFYILGQVEGKGKILSVLIFLIEEMSITTGHKPWTDNCKTYKRYSYIFIVDLPESECRICKKKVQDPGKGKHFQSFHRIFEKLRKLGLCCFVPFLS